MDRRRLRRFAFLTAPPHIAELDSNCWSIDFDDLEINEVVLHEAIGRNIRLLQKAFTIVSQFGIRMARFAERCYDLARLSDELVEFRKRESLRPSWDGILRRRDTWDELQPGRRSYSCMFP